MSVHMRYECADRVNYLFCTLQFSLMTGERKSKHVVNNCETTGEDLTFRHGASSI